MLFLKNRTALDMIPNANTLFESNNPYVVSYRELAEKLVDEAFKVVGNQ